MKSRIQAILLLFSGVLLLSLVLFTEISRTANAMEEASQSIIDKEAGSIGTQDSVTGAVWRFDHLDNDPSDGSSPKELFVTGSEVVLAKTKQRCFTLTLSHTGSGIDPIPDPSKTPPCSPGQYAPGTTIQFFGDAHEHWFLGSWTGTDGDTIPTLTMPAADHQVTVNYKPTCFALETKAVPTGGGAVDPSPGPNCPDPGPGAEYLEGTVVTLTATIFDGYRFSFWSGGVAGTITQTAVTMNSNYILTDTITANFDKACHPLILTHAPPDKGSDPQADPINSTGCNLGEYVFDENIALLNAIPIPGWLVDSWEGTDDNSSTNISNTLSFPRLPASAGSGHFVTVNYIQQSTLNFSAATYTVNEDAGSAAISVKRTGSLQEEVTVVVRSSDDTATAGQDYVPISKTLTFPKNIDDQPFSVKILDDGISEGTEYLILSLSEQSVGSEIGPQYEAELIILDDEGDPTVQFSTTSYEGAESSSTIPITITLFPPIDHDVFVEFKTLAGTAESGVDYYDYANTIRFWRGETEPRKPIEIIPINDELDEINETVQLQLSDVVGAYLGASEAVLTLLDDDDPPSVQFSAGAYFAEEGDPTAQLTVTLSAATSLTVTVGYTVVEPPNGQPIVGIIKFNPGEVSQTIDVPIATQKANDILIAVLSGEDNASPGSPSSAELIIHSECYLLTLNHTGHGAPPVVTNVTQTLGCPAGHYLAKALINVRGLPDPGWFTYGWQGTQNDDDAVPENEVQVLMPDGDHSVTAYYITSTYLPYVSKDYMVFFDGPVEVEPNNLLKTSQANGLVRSDQRYFGSFPIASDLYDVFFFNLAAKGTVQIDLMDIPPGRDYNLYLFSSDRVLESFSGSVDNQNEQIISSNLDLGLYFVAIHNAEGAPTKARYSLTVDFE